MISERFKGLSIFVGDREITATEFVALEPSKFAELAGAGSMSFSFSGKLTIKPEDAERIRQLIEDAAAHNAAQIAKERAEWLDGVIGCLMDDGFEREEITVADEGRRTIVSVNGEPRYAWGYTLGGENQP